MTLGKIPAMRLSSSCGFAIGLIICSSRFLAAGDETSRGYDHAETFAVNKHGDVLIVPMQVGHWKIPCVVDTGATHNFIDLKLQAIVGRTLGASSASTAGGGIAVPYFAAPEAQLGSVKLNQSFVLAGLDLRPFREYLGCDAQGILGMAAFHRHAVRIDFDEGRFDILTPGTKPQEDWGEPIPLVALDDGLSFHVMLSLGGIERAFLLDTGALMIGIDEALADELLRRSEMQLVQEVRMLTAAGEGISNVYQQRQFTVGRFNHKDVIVATGRHNKIGLDYLSRYRVVLDFPNRMMYLTPSARYTHAELINMAGVSLRRADNRTLVDCVDSDGPAERAGLADDDRLESVDLRPATAYSLFELRQLFGSGHQREIPVTYLRSGERRQTTLVLEDPRVELTRRPSAEPR